jgi:hypothetical protein
MGCAIFLISLLHYNCRRKFIQSTFIIIINTKPRLSLQVIGGTLLDWAAKVGASAPINSFHMVL